MLQLRRSHLGRRLKKLEVELTDDHGAWFPTPPSGEPTGWTGFRKLVNGENPPGKITDEAFRTPQDEVVIPPLQVS
jgi:hypothetical protein